MLEQIALYFEKCPEVVAVYLFGSHARNKARSMSDVDVAVLLGPTDSDFARRKRLDYILDLSKILKKDIHPVILNTAGEELLRQVFSKGKCIQIKDREALSRYRTLALAKIAEFGYYRKAIQTGFIRNLKQGGRDG